MQCQIKQGWITLWQRIQARGDGYEIYKDIAARYKEHHRHYHTLKHIKHCLTVFDPLWHLATSTNADAIRMALWFHDAIYDTKANDNEEKSAELARTVLKNASLPNEFIERAANLILATKHVSPPTDPDEKLIADIDLSPFGAPDKLFGKNSRLIRQEYDEVPEDIFKAKRRAILTSFLKRKTIYYTQFFFEKYETQARKNLARAIAQLSK